MCGKMAAGKSTCARELARIKNAVLPEAAGVDHELHFVDVSDDVCKHQLKQRSELLPAGAAWTTDAEFDAITAYFQTPAEDEGFNVLRHEQA